MEETDMIASDHQTQLQEQCEAGNNEIYCRYVIGHEDQIFGREFLEFEIRQDGLLRYANESEYKRSPSIRKEAYLSEATLSVLRRLILQTNILELSDEKWPEPATTGYQKLEIIAGKKHISFVTSKIGSLVQIAKEQDSEGLKSFYWFIQDLKAFVFSLVSLHFKIKPI